MRLLILFVTIWALATAKPEMYREKEDFEYSRSSSDDGSKSGYYGAQRGNMGGNYEHAHNMDLLAQNQMSGLVKQVDGELGTGANTRTGSVFTSGNSRGVYGSGNYDLSNLKGRNFEESSSFGGLQSHSSMSSSSGSASNFGYGNEHASNNARYSNSQSQSARQSSRFQSSGQSSSDLTIGRQQEETLHSGLQSEYDNQAANNYKYYAQGSNLRNSDTQDRYISVNPVKVYIRPGSRITIPVSAQTYDASHFNALHDQNSINSDTGVVSGSGRGVQYNPITKHYESSYKYKKEWEKHDTQTFATPTENPFPQNSEFYDSSQVSQDSKHLDNRNINRHSGAQLNHINNAYSNGFSAGSKSSSFQSRYQSGLTADSQNSESALTGSRSKDFLHEGLTGNIGEDTNSRPKHYHSSYSYHKAWERQGDPYVIEPVSSDSANNLQSSQRLTAASQNYGHTSSHQHGSHYSQSRQSYSTGCSLDCGENGHIRIARSYNTNEKPSAYRDNFEQQSQNEWENTEDLGQQTQDQWSSSTDLGQQTQDQWSSFTDLGQETQNKWDNLENLGQQTQDNWDHLDSLSQKEQNKWENQEELGQQSQNIWEHLENLHQHPQRNLHEMEDMSHNLQNISDRENVEQNSRIFEIFDGPKKDEVSQEEVQNTQNKKEFGEKPQDIWTMIEQEMQKDVHTSSSSQSEGNIFTNIEQKATNNQQNEQTTNWNFYHNINEQNLDNGQISHIHSNGNDWHHGFNSGSMQQTVDTNNKENAIHNLWDKLEEIVYNLETQNNMHENSAHNKIIETTTKSFKTIERGPKNTLSTNVDKIKEDKTVSDLHMVQPIDIGRGDIGPEDFTNESPRENINSHNLHKTKTTTASYDRKTTDDSIDISVINFDQDSMVDSTTKNINEVQNSHMITSNIEQFNENLGQQNIDQQNSHMITSNIEQFNENLGQQNIDQQSDDFGQQNVDSKVEEIQLNMEQHLEDFGQQNMNQNLEGFGQQNLDQQLEVFEQQNMGQQLQDFEQQNFDHKLDLGHQNFENVGQQNIDQNLQAFGEQNMGQESEDFGQKNMDQQLEVFGQQNLNQQLEDFSQQNMDQQLEDLGQTNDLQSQTLENFKQSEQMLQNVQTNEQLQKHAQVNEFELNSAQHNHNNDLNQQQKIVEEPKGRSLELDAPEEPVTEKPVTEKPGFWASVGNKFTSAKNTVAGWFKRS